MNKILLTFGTRPEAIKMAPLVKELVKHDSVFDLTICSTAQHREMLDQVLSVFDIKPHIDLNLMSPNQTLSDLSGDALIEITKVLEREKPDLVLVQGDTTTAMIIATAAFYKKIPVGHVEAGLRTNDRYNPFPEEINRRLISVLSTFHFAPTQTAVDALLAEGISEEKIYKTGNTVIDAVQQIAKKDLSKTYWNLVKTYRLNSNEHKLILVTAHRRESFGKPLENICLALAGIAESHPNVKMLYPVHYNPNVHELVHKLLQNNERVYLTDPLDYETFVQLMKLSYMVLTDSGGIQEEAPALGKPVLVMRDVTERPEAVEAGTVKIVGTNVENIVRECENLLLNAGAYKQMARAVSPYGDGEAAQRIVKILMDEMK